MASESELYQELMTDLEFYQQKLRDSILGEHIHGAFPNSYMTTVKRFPPSYEAITRNGEYCGVVRGLWELAGDMMGGPFVSHAYLDTTNQRVVVAETFVYANLPFFIG